MAFTRHNNPKHENDTREARWLFLTATFVAIVLGVTKAPTSLLMSLPVVSFVVCQLWISKKLHDHLLIQLLLSTCAGTLALETTYLLTHHLAA